MIPSTYLLLDSSDPKVFKWFEPINNLEKQTCLVEMYVSGYSGIYPNPDLFNSYLKIFGSNGAKMDFEIIPNAKSLKVPSGYNQWRMRIEAKVTKSAQKGKANKPINNIMK